MPKYSPVKCNDFINNVLKENDFGLIGHANPKKLFQPFEFKSDSETGASLFTLDLKPESLKPNQDRFEIISYPREYPPMGDGGPDPGYFNSKYDPVKGNVLSLTINTYKLTADHKLEDHTQRFVFQVVGGECRIAYLEVADLTRLDYRTCYALIKNVDPHDPRQRKLTDSQKESATKLCQRYLPSYSETYRNDHIDDPELNPAPPATKSR